LNEHNIVVIVLSSFNPAKLAVTRTLDLRATFKQDKENLQYFSYEYLRILERSDSIIAVVEASFLIYPSYNHKE